MTPNMISSNSLSVLLLSSAVNAQLFNGPVRPPDAFSYVQPADTVILTQYNSSEPVYPSPQIVGTIGWEVALEKARAFVAQLTPEEKADMVTGQPGPCIGNIVGIPRLNFSGLCLQDGPASLRIANYASSFPSGVTIASSWDKKMLYERGLAMGREFKGKGAHVALAPVAGPLGRSAYCGLNWEGFSPDPYLTGIAMQESVLGLQDAGVQATAKHFILNEQEILRNAFSFPNGSVQYEAISSNVDDRTLHELYMWPFANAIHSHAAAVMCSYQRINGSYACQNSKVLNGYLKTELGFQGYVMSDWFAVHSGVASIEAGLDMDMPGFTLPFLLGNGPYESFLGTNVSNAISNGTVGMDRLDDMITRIMTPYYALHQDEDIPPIAVFGNDAGEITEGPINQDIFEFGTLAVGGGSGAAQFSYLISPLQAIKERALETGAIVEAWLNNTYVSQVTETAITGAGGILLANTPDVCLVFLKGWASEGVDRETLDLDWSANEVVEAVAGACNNTVVITHSSGINDLPWADHPNVTAILVAHYPGQESGNSIVDVLYGDVNPSGHLPYTIAFNGSDYNSPVVTSINTTGSDDWQSYFTERLEIDYRFLTPKILMFAMNLGLAFPDGQITSHAEELETQPGGNPALWEVIYTANVVVYNTGDVRGNVVPQLYVSFPSSTPAGTPLRQLRGFEKVELTSGQRASVDFELMRRDLSYWDINSQQWLIPEGEFTLHVGLSSRDLHGSTVFTAVTVGAPGNSTIVGSGGVNSTTK
ncbi:(Trans)glycosidase [Glarea lozoyensis ATCC 20868]|uniref:Probable beta-glucosidase G n=1 Tax=Glarea lozoyensis (strain ATCC 20868 / MF5171) TaxID=1116229 RepID=S3CYF7_GLAL2|nr:(Trans)glycosidase [Glarea lozoyensis ATCC 20868]EPE29989.1 (Trans)glycosidase [Glarea lozoyensis ATCC 20868]